MTTTRRQFLSTATAALAAAPTLVAAPKAAPLVIIDTHTHFYDPSRPTGVPWPGKGDAVLYRPTLPANYRAQEVPQPVTGTVVVEASPLVEDNQWILDLAAKDKFIVGFVGNLKPGEDAFAGHLKRFAANPLYRGIRVNEGALRTGLGNAAFIADIKRLADADLELDLNGGPTLLPEVTRLAKELPTLRIVINHLSNTRIDGKNVSPTWRSDLEAAAKFPKVFLKVSALVEGTGRRDGDAPRGRGMERLRGRPAHLREQLAGERALREAGDRAGNRPRLLQRERRGGAGEVLRSQCACGLPMGAQVEGCVPDSD